MEIKKDKGLIYSQYVLDFLGYYVETKDVSCHVEAFSNGREQGYVMRFYSDDFNFYDKNSLRGLTIYIYAHRVSDEPTITWENKLFYGDLYTEDAWINRTKTFDYSDIRGLTMFAKDLIEECFKEGEKDE